MSKILEMSQSSASTLDYDNSNLTDITTDQELFIDGTSSVITSNGREPISGMNLGTFIPPKINIDGVEYDHPNNIGGDDRGCFGFFEDWENIVWKTSGSWAISGAGMAVSNVGDWLKFDVTGSNTDWARAGILTGDSYRKAGSLFKKGTAAKTYFGFAGDGTVNNAIIDWSLQTVTAQAYTTHEEVWISPELLWIVTGYNAASISQATYIASELGTTYIKDFFYSLELPFIPPYGMDGHSKNDARAYNFDKWDHPISFKFKPAFDYDNNESFIISDYGINVSFELAYRSGTPDSQFRLALNANVYDIWHNGANWVRGAVGGGDGISFTNNVILQQDQCLY